MATLARYPYAVVSVNEIRGLTGTTYPAANELVQRLADIGVVSEATGHARNRRFRYDPYIRLFTDEALGDAQ